MNQKIDQKRMKQQAASPIQCVICLNPPKNQSKIDACDHKFCFKCITTWAKRKLNCPVCRAHFSKVTDRRKRIRRYIKKPPEPVRRSVYRIRFLHILQPVFFPGVCFVQFNPLTSNLTEPQLQMFPVNMQNSQ